MTRLFIKDKEGTTFLKSYDIFHIEASRSSTDFHLEDEKKITASLPLKHWLEELEPCGKFIRIHNSHAVNKHEIMRIESHSVILRNDKVVAMNPKLKEEVEAIFVAINASHAVGDTADGKE